MKFLLAHSTCDTFKFDDPYGRLAHLPPFRMSCFCLFSHIVSASVFDQICWCICGRFWHPFGIHKHMFLLYWFFNVYFIDFTPKCVQNGAPKWHQKLPFWYPKSTRFLRGSVFESRWLIWADFDAFLVAFWSHFNAIFLPFWYVLALSLDSPELLGVSARMFLSSHRAIANMPLHAHSKPPHRAAIHKVGRRDSRSVNN